MKKTLKNYLMQYKRLRIIREDIKKAERYLEIFKVSLSSYYYTLSNGRKVKLTIKLIADDDDFDEQQALSKFNS